MPLSQKKQAKLERQKREEYVKSCSYRNSTFIPFGDTNWDIAANKYIETGDEALKKEFPSPREESI